MNLHLVRRSLDAFAARAFVVLALGSAFACAKPRPAEAPQVSPSADVTPSAPQAETNTGDDEAPPAWTKPFLWRIEGKAPSYLFATIHVADTRLAPAPDAVISAFNDVQVLNTEVPMDKLDAATLAPRIQLPGSRTLCDVLSPATCTRIEGAITARRLPWEPFRRMKPWVIATQLTFLDRVIRNTEQPPLDAGLYQEARDANKEVGGLETVDEQFAALDGLSAEEQAYMVKDALDSLDRKKAGAVDPVAEILDAYISGEDDAATRVIAKAPDPKNAVAIRIHKRLITDRNVVMATRIAKRLQSGKAHLFAIGLAHLLGNDNIVALLGKRGLKVTRVDAVGESAAPVRIQPTPRVQP